jgi:hypothetical protein
MGHTIVVFYLDFAFAVAASWVLVKLAGLIGRNGGRDDDDDSGGGGRGGWEWRRKEGPGRPGPERGPGHTSPRRQPVGRRPRVRR